jgi:aminopeptidase-like protein
MDSECSSARSAVPGGDAGKEMHGLIRELYPICRSITGHGVRESLKLVQQHIPLSIHEVPSGTAVFDWTVPREWNITDAYIKRASGETVVDFKRSNLHVMSYSMPVKKKLPLAELKAHLFTIPEHPDWIPYRTSYYKEQWGFCLSHRQLESLKDGEYEVCIESSLVDGHLTYGEYFLPGATEDEVLIYTHSCHPSLCNDNLSGIAVSVFLARWLSQIPRRYSYRFLYCPGTIGSITWLSLNEARSNKIKHGLVLACVGDPGKPTYKKSRRGTAEIDRAVLHVLKQSWQDYHLEEFSPYGYDERQFCSPGFNLPVGCLMRTPHGQYPEYHTSADNLELVQPQALADSLTLCRAVVNVLEHNQAFLNLSPKGEPQLGKRGLYKPIGGDHSGTAQLALLWVLNLSDGRHTLLDIAERAGIEFETIRTAAARLNEKGLLKESDSLQR